jgi:hypothetical protein
MNEFDASEAAALLDQATSRARRSFDRRPPLLVLFGAAVFLAAFGGVWWSVRRQHPYHGPAGWALGLLYGLIVLWAAAVAYTSRRAGAGVAGRTRRRQRLEAVAFVPIWVSVFALQGALHHAGASDAIAYGIYPATAPFIIVGGAAAARSAALENWREVGVAISLVCIGVGASFAGPAAVWLTMGIGLSVVLVSLAGVQFWQSRAAHA